jgi:hypothetical protein
MNRVTIFLAGVLAVILTTWLWHGPLGHGERFADRVDARARAMLDLYEMPHVKAVMERAPLTRRVVLSGQADDFQRREIKHMVEEQPGVGQAVWDPSSMQSEQAR